MIWGRLRSNGQMVSSIQSKDRYDVETNWGQHFIGSLENGEEQKQVIVVTADARATLALTDIVRINPLEASFLKSLKGYIDAGFSYQTSNKFAELTLGAEVNHRTIKWSNKLNGSIYLRTQKEGNDTKRSNMDYTLMRLFRNRWSGAVFGNVEQNDELDLVLRVLVGVGGGRYFVQNNNMLFLLFDRIDWQP